MQQTVTEPELSESQLSLLRVLEIAKFCNVPDSSVNGVVTPEFLAERLNADVLAVIKDLDALINNGMVYISWATIEGTEKRKKETFGILGAGIKAIRRKEESNEEPK
jgi:hypothetical protein